MVVIVMPDWFSKAEKELDECVDEIVRKNNIHWAFAHDSISIKEGKSAILNALVAIDEKVKDPFQPTRQETKEFEESLKPFKKYKRKYPLEMESLLRRNIHKATNQELVELVKVRFGVKTTKSRLSNYMFLRGISRKKRHFTKEHKRKIGKGVKRSHRNRKSPRKFDIDKAKKISELTWFQARRAGLSKSLWKSGQKNRE